MEQISTVSDILINSIFDKSSCSKSIKKATAFGFWRDICGSKFSKFSIPYDIKGNTLFVAVKNPQVMQELIFYKTSVLSKIKDYFNPLNITIEDIRYDYKIWNKINSNNTIKGDDSLFYYSKNEIEDVDLDNYEEDELSKVKNTVSKMSCLDETLKKKYLKNITNCIKANKLRKERGV